MLSSPPVLTSRAYLGSISHSLVLGNLVAEIPLQMQILLGVNKHYKIVLEFCERDPIRKI